MKIVKLLGKVLLNLWLAVMTLWGAMAVYYSNLPNLLRQSAALIFTIFASALIIRSFRKTGQWRIFFLVFAAIFLWWWLAIQPSNTRNWQPDLRILPWAEINGDSVTVHNIRNCDYRSETDYTVRHYDRTFDLKQLESLDLYHVYWGSPSIAHTMLSFGFGNGRYLCFSIETRKEVGEDYSAIKGFFKQFELTYVVADERDLVRLRTNYREGGKGEDVYLYRLNVPISFVRQVITDYLREVNNLKDHPEWYRAIAGNCTTNIRRHTAPFNPDARFDWRIIVNGYLDEMLYERNALDRSLPLPELKKRSRINEQAKKVTNTDDFSRLIRVGLPGMKP